MTGIWGSFFDATSQVIGGALGGLAHSQLHQGMAQQMQNLAVYQAQQEASLIHDPYASLRGAALLANLHALASPRDPLAELCPVLSEPDPIIRPDPWYRRWWVALLRWIVRRLP